MTYNAPKEGLVARMWWRQTPFPISCWGRTHWPSPLLLATARGSSSLCTPVCVIAGWECAPPTTSHIQTRLSSHPCCPVQGAFPNPPRQIHLSPPLNHQIDRISEWKLAQVTTEARLWNSAIKTSYHGSTYADSPPTDCIPGFQKAVSKA